jgi:hypothetical protein
LLLKNKDHKDECTGFQPVSKKFKHSSKWLLVIY